MTDNHDVEEPKENDKIGLWGVDSFDKDKRGVVREGLSEYPYLLILMNILYSDW